MHVYFTMAVIKIVSSVNGIFKFATSLREIYTMNARLVIVMSLQHSLKNVFNKGNHI